MIHSWIIRKNFTKNTAMMKLEYLILIVLAIGFYETSIKEDKKIRNNKDFIENNLDIGSIISTYSGIIGEVIEISGESVVILSGNSGNISSLNIKKSEIKNIIG